MREVFESQRRRSDGIPDGWSHHGNPPTHLSLSDSTKLKMTVMLVLIEGHSDRGMVALVQIVAQGWVRQGWKMRHSRWAMEERWGAICSSQDSNHSNLLYNSKSTENEKEHKVQISLAKCKKQYPWARFCHKTVICVVYNWHMSLLIWTHCFQSKRQLGKSHGELRCPLDLGYWGQLKVPASGAPQFHNYLSSF